MDFSEIATVSAEPPLMFKILSWGALLLLAHPLTILAQTCADSIPQITPSSDFKINADGTALHLPTGLMWSRCSLGQQWNGATCLDAGETADNYFVWQHALQKADEFVFAGYADWRLANIKELASIIETACKNPAINLAVFPNTPEAEVYWSSTPSSYSPNQAWYIAFSGGSDNNYVKSNLNRVRPVRQYSAAMP